MCIENMMEVNSVPKLCPQLQSQSTFINAN